MVPCLSARQDLVETENRPLGICLLTSAFLSSVATSDRARCFSPIKQALGMNRGKFLAAEVSVLDPSSLIVVHYF